MENSLNQHIEDLSCENCTHYIIVDACYCECCSYPGDEYCGILLDEEYETLPNNFNTCDKFVPKVELYE